MHSIIGGRPVVLAATLIAACADSVGPIPRSADDPTVVAALVRERPTTPVSVPDSVGIPPSIPPIFEQLPPDFEAPQ